jgi:hypothetical protein
MSRDRIDGTALGILIPAYAIVFGLFAFWFYSLLQPRYSPNPGVAAYQPPPATVISYDLPERLLIEHRQAPPLVEIEGRAEEPKAGRAEAPNTTEASKKVAEREPERIIEVRKPKRPKTPAPKAARQRERDSPLTGYAAAHSWYSGNRPY